MTRKPTFELIICHFALLVAACAPAAAEQPALQVDSVGILLGDKTAGPFDLQIDWVKIEVPK